MAEYATLLVVLPAILTEALTRALSHALAALWVFRKLQNVYMYSREDEVHS